MAAMQGYEPGSVFASLPLAEQRRFRSWLKDHHGNARVFEAQLADKPFVRPRRPAEV